MLISMFSEIDEKGLLCKQPLFIMNIQKLSCNKYFNWYVWIQSFILYFSKLALYIILEFAYIVNEEYKKGRD